MNHSDRIYHVARQHRDLTRRLTQKAVELYLAALADDLAAGDWVELKGIGKLQVVVEAGHGSLWVKTSRGQRELRPVRRSLRTRIRLFRAFKDRCYRRDVP